MKKQLKSLKTFKCSYRTKQIFWRRI